MGEGELPTIDFVDLEPAHNCAGFECRNGEIDEWVRNRAHKEHRPGAVNVTCALRHGETRPIGVYAISTVAEEIANLPGHHYRPFRSGKHFPAMHLVWLATDHKFTGMGLGSLMVGRVIRTFADIGTCVGIPHLILTPADQDKERLVAFYARLGFSPYKDGDSMYLHIDTAREAIAAAQAEVARGG